MAGVKALGNHILSASNAEQSHKDHLSTACFMHNSRLFRCVETNNCCKWPSPSTAATVSVSSRQSVSGLFISENFCQLVLINTSRTRYVLPRKYTWPLGGYFRWYNSGRYMLSKSETARAGACTIASSRETPSFFSSPYATSSRASNLVNMATTGTAKNKLQTRIFMKIREFIAYHSQYHTLKRSSALRLWMASRHPSGCNTWSGRNESAATLICERLTIWHAIASQA
jgi:hypothetical protein